MPFRAGTLAIGNSRERVRMPLISTAYLFSSSCKLSVEAELSIHPLRRYVALVEI